MKNQTLLVIGFILSLTASCGEEAAQQENINITIPPEAYKEGALILEQHCLSCHSPERSIAPNLSAIKKAYITEDLSEVAFVKSMTGFLFHPTENSAKIPEAVQQFGLMPNLGMTTEQYVAVSSYLFRSDLDDPDWATKHQKAVEEYKNQTAGAEVNYLKEGMNLALATKAVLGKNLLTAIKEKGTEEALAFCNTKAIDLTDSMATVLNASIKRVSDKNRNPDNLANENELVYIQEVKQTLVNGGEVKPQLTELEDQVIGYYPILTNTMCLQCHGEPNEDIKEGTLEKLAELYPEDKATGYTENQLRGIWVIKMERK